MVAAAEENKALGRMLTSLEIIRGVYPDASVQFVSVLLFIGTNEGCSQKDIMQKLGMTDGSVSRNVAMLSDVKYRGKTGLGLVRQDIDPEERRRRILTLTRKGQAFFNQLRSVMTEK